MLVVNPGLTQTNFSKNMLEQKAQMPTRPPARHDAARRSPRRRCKAIERGKLDVTLTLKGKLLVLVNRFAPWVVDFFAKKKVRELFADEIAERKKKQADSGDEVAGTPRGRGRLPSTHKRPSDGQEEETRGRNLVAVRRPGNLTRRLTPPAHRGKHRPTCPAARRPPPVVARGPQPRDAQAVLGRPDAVRRRGAGRARPCFPPAADVFNAFRYTPLDEVKVAPPRAGPVPTPGHAHGLCFSVRPGVTAAGVAAEHLPGVAGRPRHRTPVKHGYLAAWARQGVLMLNAVPDGAGRARRTRTPGRGGRSSPTRRSARSTTGRGPVVFLLWGRYAQKKAKLIDAERGTSSSSRRPPVAAVGRERVLRQQAVLEDQRRAGGAGRDADRLAAAGADGARRINHRGHRGHREDGRGN